MADTGSTLKRDLYILEDENNPMGSKSDKIYPSTILDQVYDDVDPDNKNLREILDEIREEIATGGGSEIPFPVKSVNGKRGDVTINKSDIGLNKVDNTSDNEKPMSEQQRDAVMDILEHYDFPVDLQPLYDHMADHQNPHNVTYEQINAGGEITDAVAEGVNTHAISNVAHQDIRQQIVSAKAAVDQGISALSGEIDTTVAAINNHLADQNAHSEILDRKENSAKKVPNVTEATTNYDNYPSTKAMVNYVANAIDEYMRTHNLQGGIQDILVVRTLEDMPPAGVALLKVAYLILTGEHNTMELAICRQTENRYYWDYTDLEAYTKFDGSYFKYDINKGLTLDISEIGSSLIGDHEFMGSVESSLTSNDGFVGEFGDKLLNNEGFVSELDGTLLNDDGFVGEFGDKLLNNEGFVDNLEDTCKEMDLPIGTIPINPASTVGLSMWVETGE